MSRARSLTDAPFDRGLQAERTALAWRRTALSLALGSLAAARVLAAAFGLWSYAIGMLGLAASALFLFSADRRYRRAHESLVASSAAPTGARLASGGLLLAALTVIALAAAVLGTIFVIVAATR
ncbi:DUF202 domain-containing protein [Subtercola endophyticus]|uniref:DUF202 domain-containing protein n=1 Tax=Subtercola endophyticus TaxID=2895559 RepID=UPI001E58A38F|nr:DUF202 domain-containing protein [Subtercola endophyticus]UFS59724.1 DUF202 domain-containing protein [Subtercola endophyticus]